MSTEVWFRDPAYYVKELVEVGTGNIVWNRGALAKKRLDPVAWAEIFYGSSIPWRLLAVGPQGTAELGPGRNFDRPVAVYPTWAYGDEPAFLEDMMARNVGDDLDACFDATVPADERPVPKQEHRVVVTSLPAVNTGQGRSLMRWLKELQESYPDAILHVHGLYSYRYAFGLGFRAADMESRSDAAKGRITLASGVDIDWQKVQKHGNWVTAMGMTPGELNEPRNRCMFNIRSAIWAGKNYATLHNQPIRPTKVDFKAPDASYVAPSTKRALPVAAVPRPGDKSLCNLCSLQLDCKQYRKDEVCSLSDGNTARLAQFFKTRNSDVIIDGLGTLMAMQANRLESAAAEEQALGDINPEVTKLVNSLFAQGVQLAKLVDPKLRGGGTKVNVGIINGQASVSSSASTPAELTGHVVRALEAQGIPREKITAELVMATIQGMQNPDLAHRAIEGTAIAEEG